MKKKYVIFLCVLVAVTFSLVTYFTTGYFMKTSNNGRIYVEKDEYDFLMQYFEIGNISDIVAREYYKDVDEAEITSGALSGSINILNDGYSKYYPEEDYSWFDDTLEGSYIGQGLMLEKDEKTGYLKVTRVFAETAAYDANVLKGDLITSIDGRDTRQIDVENAVARLRGKSGAEIKLKIISEDSQEEMEISFMRRDDDIQLVYDDMLTDEIGYMSVVEFGASTAQDFEKAIKVLNDNNAKKLIIDLRGVPGGYISAATDAADLFLEEGIIAAQHNREKEVTKWEADSSIKWSKPIVILTDAKTSGSAEVFAAALKENGKAITIGETTAGKGYTTKYFDLNASGDGIRLITGGYTTPDGNDLATKGIEPDQKVNNTDAVDANSDAVLKEALKYFEK